MAALGPKAPIALDAAKQLVIFNPAVPANTELDKSPIDEQAGMVFFEAIDLAMGGDGSGNGDWPIAGTGEGGGGGGPPTLVWLQDAILDLLNDPATGPILAGAIVDTIGGDAIAAQMIADMTADERTAWLNTMFAPEVIDYAPKPLTAAAGVLVPNGASGMFWTHTLTANVVDVNPLNLSPGIAYPIEFTQGGAGGFTIAFGLNTGGNREIGLSSPVIDTEVGRIAYVTITNIGTVAAPVYRVLPGPRDNV